MKKIIFLLLATMFLLPTQALATNTVELEVEKENIYASVMTPTLSIWNTADNIRNYIFDNGDGTYSTLEYSPLLGITVSTYQKNHQLLKTQKVELELTGFGGFYQGEHHYYIAYFTGNTEQDDNKEVFRIVQYDKNFNRINHVSVRNCYTVAPADAGTLRMCEKNGTLVVHTCRRRYNGHQSQLTIIIDTASMTIKNEETITAYPPNHVSHSFNQFVINDGNFVLMDLGDGYPRGIVLNRYHPTTGFEGITSELLVIPGAIGANCTGVTVGGLECSDDNYLVPINKIDFNKVTEFTSYEMIGLDKDERDIVLLVQNKDFSVETKQITLANYVNQNKLGSTPYIVKISNNKFVVLWQEFEYVGDYIGKNHGVKYVYVDGNGNLLSEVMTESNLKLSSDCQPIVMDHQIVWFINDWNPYSMDMKEDMFFSSTHTKLLQSLPIISTEKNGITVTINDKKIEFDQEPITINDRTMVPLRAIFEELGAVVDWDDATQTVTATKNDVTIQLTINDSVMLVNGKSVTLDSPACLVNSRTLVPVRAISEAFHCQVDWQEETKTVLITY